VDSIRSLTAALGDADPEVRRLAARALSSRDSLSTEAAAALEAALKDMEPGPAGAAAAGGSP
jgi:HEAT repeat protein